MTDFPRQRRWSLMDLSRLSFLDRFISRMVKAEEADRRDWDAIRRWASAIEV